MMKQSIVTSYEMSCLECIATLEGHKDRVWSVAWSHSGTVLATCGGDKAIRLWKTENEQYVCKCVLDGGHQRTVRSVAWSPSGRKLASASFDATVGIWELKDGEFEQTVTLEGHENEVKSVAWSPSGSLLATCSRDKSVWIWEVMEEDEDYECVSVLHDHTQDVKHVQWHPTEEILVSCGYDDTIHFYKEDGDDWSSFATLEGHQSTVWAVAFESSGNRLVSCSADKSLKIWQCYRPGNTLGVPVQGKDPRWCCVCTLSGYHTREIYDVAWSRDGFIATACGDDGVRIFYEGPSSAGCPNEPIFTLLCTVEQAHATDVNSVSWNPKQPGLLASCSDDGTVKVWKLKTDGLV